MRSNFDLFDFEQLTKMECPYCHEVLKRNPEENERLWIERATKFSETHGLNCPDKSTIRILGENENMDNELKIKDSGERDSYPSGAVRDNSANKGRFDLMSGQGLLRLARWYELGARKYADRNWEKGMNISRYVDAAMRHLIKYMMGCDDEDHLSAVAWNVFAIMHHEVEKPEMQDLPSWQGRTTKWFYKLDKGD